MRARFLSVPFFAAALLALAGCSTLHSWAQVGSDHPARAGASVSVPLGK